LKTCFGKYVYRIKNKAVNKTFELISPNYHKHNYFSLNIFKSKLPQMINDSGADLVHFHWIGTELIAIEQFKLIKIPIIITLHDMWLFNGVCHLNYSDIIEYLPDRSVLPNNNLLLNKIDNWAINRKLKNWKDINFRIICPSHWMDKKLNDSIFKGKFKAKVIPNIIDNDVWYRVDSTIAKKELGLPLDKPILLFGNNNPSTLLKGKFLLDSSLGSLSNNSFVIATFGEKVDFNSNVDTQSFGKINNDDLLRKLYSASDIVLIPSLLENLPNVALESIACGTPVVAFDTGGLSDIISHRRSGYLAKKFDPSDFACGIKFILRSRNQIDYKSNCLGRLDTYFNKTNIINSHLSLYEDHLNDS